MAEMTETRAKIELFKVAKDTYGDVHYFKTLQEAKSLSLCASRLAQLWVVEDL